MAGRPRSRQRNVSGAGKGISRRGSGLGTGRVGSSGGYSGRPGRTGGSGGSSFGGGFSSGSSGSSYGSGGGRRVVRSSGGGSVIKLIVLVIILLVGGGSGISGIFTDGFDEPIGGYDDYWTGDYSQNMASIFENLGGGSVSSGWDNGSNTGVLNTSVDAGARDKYTEILGNG